MDPITELNTFIKTLQDPREIKRALSVKLCQQGYPPTEVSRMLDSSASYVSKWNKVYREQGLPGLRLAYKGSVGYLTPAQRQSVLAWIRAQTHWEIATLCTHLQAEYGVLYKSRQSYYALFKAAGLSQKKIPEK